MSVSERYNGMDPYAFINSKEIGDYLREIDYPVTAQQAAYFVWLNRSMTLAEKHAAWEDIIDKLPDEEIPESLNCTYRKSLHEFLRQQMTLDERFIVLFFDDPEAGLYESSDDLSSNVDATISHRSVFYYEIREGKGLSTRSALFDEPRFCLSAALADAASYVAIGCDEDELSLWITREYLVYGKSSDSEGERLLAQAKKGDSPALSQPHSIALEVALDGAVRKVVADLPLQMSFGSRTYLVKGIPTETEDEWDLERCGFEGFYYSIPIPFKKGDIVCDCFDLEPFVLTGTVPWFRKEQGKEHLDEAGHGDSTDMGAFGEDIENLIEILKGTGPACGIDGVGNYLDLIHYPNPLHGKERLLAVYGNAIKGKISPRQMIVYCNTVLADEYYRAYREWLPADIIPRADATNSTINEQKSSG